MGNSTLGITTGASANLKTFLNAGSAHIQYVQDRLASSASPPDLWTVATTAATSHLAADVTRVGLLMTNTSTGSVYVRFDTSAPTSTNYHWRLDTGERWEVPAVWVQLAVSLLGQIANGTLITAIALDV